MILYSHFIASQDKKLKRNDPKLCTEAQLKEFLTLVLSDEAMIRFIRWLSWQQAVQEADKASQPSTSSTSPASVVSLVARTQQHHTYATNYSFNSWLKGWAWIRKRALNQAQPRLLSLDCEMVETDLDRDSLVGFCLVDGDGKVVMKSLVKPKGNVLDYRTSLTGLTAKDLELVTLTREDARKQVKAILQQDGGSIICGHAVHNDLKALRIHHPDVIDTSLIFRYKDLPLCSPSLKDLAKLILGLEIRTGEGSHHDSYEDAFVTMKLIRHELSKGPTRLLTPPDIKVAKDDLKKLFVHRLPNGLKESDLTPIFRHCAFESIDGDLSSRKALLVFKSLEDANSAFKDLSGAETTDNFGRAQKEVNMALHKSFLVRKMAGHNGRLFGRDRTGLKEMQAKLFTKKKPARSKKGPKSPKRTYSARKVKGAYVRGKGKGIGKGANGDGDKGEGKATNVGGKRKRSTPKKAKDGEKEGEKDAKKMKAS